MTMLHKKLVYLCVPIAFGLPLIFLALTALQIVTALWVLQVEPHALDIVVICCMFALLALSISTITFINAIWRIEIQQNSIICKGLMPRDTFSLEYEKCSVGMDWHIQNGNKVWWIYLCYGRKPLYQTKKPSNRMNTLKCKPGFIRIMYRDEVYDALISVLPKKQKNALETSRKCAGFDKQGRII